ncbi:hypothetical protein H6P81_011961 [Aristolochia fimbriata]|uniref:Uncharacterized protein n=1 Tax=Aristolochia fimbriata TaxID=158543 RepID=A0AAV7EF22_ARIFI|nr:hypothetical protein H6P81_011961 [Aristolochia fimbriata]
MEKAAHDKGRGSKLKKIIKTLSRCRTLTVKSSLSSSSTIPFVSMSKSKSWPRHAFDLQEQEKQQHSTKARVAPEGCFSVYVGPERERFVVKTEYANHPLFKTLLEEAEMEYGFDSQGPLALPCDVSIFHRVLWEMDNEEVLNRGCGFAKGYSAYRPLTPARV